MGMDGLNNAVVPGYATPEQYTKDITIANDGIVDQAPVFKYASRCYDKLPMPNGDTVKKALYRQIRRKRILVSNRFMVTRLLTANDGRIAGATTHG